MVICGYFSAKAFRYGSIRLWMLPLLAAICTDPSSSPAWICICCSNIAYPSTIFVACSRKRSPWRVREIFPFCREKSWVLYEFSSSCMCFVMAGWEIWSSFEACVKLKCFATAMNTFSLKSIPVNLENAYAQFCCEVCKCGDAPA